MQNNLTFSKRRIQKNLFLTVMLAIPVIHFFVFWLYLNINSFVLAFQNAKGDFVGWANFQWFWENLTSDRPALDMGIAIKNTVIFWLFGTFVEGPIAIAISYFVYKRIRGYNAFRVITYLPCIIGSMVMVAVYKSFIRSEGPLDIIVQTLGGEPIPKFLYDSRYALGATLVYNLWNGFGTSIILYSGAMERIPKEVVDYAYLDGVTPWKEVVHITFPLIWPTWSMMFILSVGDIFTAGGPTLLLTGGNYETMTISFAMFQQVYFYDQVTRAAAIGSIFTLIGVPLVLFSRWLLSKIRTTEEY